MSTDLESSSDQELEPSLDAAEPADQLTDELARKYDPERLLTLVSRRAGRGESLEHSVRARYEKRFGVDLSHVRVYTGEFAEEFNRQRNAYAVTVGSTGMILMGGSPDKALHSASGQALLAHELTHVAQAQRGLHRKSSFDGAMPFAEEHEAEAEATEAAVLQEVSGVPSAGQAAVDAATARNAREEAHRNVLEEIRERVFAMAAEAARIQLARNGSQRRP
ncbi:MAG: DUF4157 domain-containing protein [Kofleriaceae bacterium]